MFFDSDFISKEDKNLLKHQHYKIIGQNSGVKLCLWTRRSLVNKGFCYKEKFYGIKSHRCLQMSPSLMSCTYSCIFCWRIKKLLPKQPEKIDDPEDIVENSIIAQRQLLSGFKGNKNVNIEKWKEAQNPNQVAISLVGEPLLYPKISELIDLYNKKNFTTFVVTNGSIPEKISEIKPTQLYISMNAPDEEKFKRICNPYFKNSWERFNETLEIFSTRKDIKKVIRMTLIKYLNNDIKDIKNYAKLIEKANPDFIEVKSFMFVGGSRQNDKLSLDKMLNLNEIMDFSKNLEKEINYKIKDYKEESRVALLAKS